MRMPTLYQFFRHQLGHGFAARGLAEPATIEYVSDMLTRFAHTRTLHAVSDARGQPLEYIVDYLAAEHGDDARPDRARRRSILCHLGEYTLFMSGLFRDRLKSRGELGYFLTQGANAYLRCADIEPQPGRRQLFGRLHHNFARIADALDEMRRLRFPLQAPANRETMLAALWRI